MQQQTRWPLRQPHPACGDHHRADDLPLSGVDWGGGELQRGAVGNGDINDSRIGFFFLPVQY